MKLMTRLKPMVKNMQYGKYSFFAFDDLTQGIRDFSEQVSEYDAFVGIPRSGLFVALGLGMLQGKKVFTPTSFFKQQEGWGDIHRKMDKVLLVDDSLSTGKTMREVKEFMGDVDTAVVFIKEGMESSVDHYYKVTGKHRIFEWNMMHKKWYSLACDMDGVLCKDPVEVNEESYRNLEPLYLPSYKIDYIITNRLEKYREVTEEWLEKHGVGYGNLIMWDVDKPIKGQFGRHKLDMVFYISPDVVFESCDSQAKYIHFNTGIPTLSIEKMLMYI